MQNVEISINMEMKLLDVLFSNSPVTFLIPQKSKISFSSLDLEFLAHDLVLEVIDNLGTGPY